MKKNTQFILEGNIKKIFYRYLVNSIIGTVVISMYILADTMFVGYGIGSDGLAALNICLPIFNILNATGLLLGIGGATTYSVYLGHKEKEKARNVFTFTITVALIIGLFYTVIGIFFLKDIAYLFGATKDDIHLVVDYLNGIVWFHFVYLLVPVFATFIRNDFRPKLTMMAAVVSGITNIIIDYIFIFILHLGMFGAALATSISTTLSLLILLSHFFSKRCNLRFTHLSFDFNVMKTILKNGQASFIIDLSNGLIILFFNLTIIRIIGAVGVSAYSIIANISLVVLAIFNGISLAIQPIISINFGANLVQRIHYVKRKAIFYAIGIGLFFFLIGQLFPRLLILAFTKDTGEIIVITTNGIRIYFISYLLAGINIVLGTYYQAKENYRMSTFISLSRGIIFTSIGLIVLPIFFGLNGVWMTVVFSESITLILIPQLKKIDYFRSKKEIL